MMQLLNCKECIEGNHKGCLSIDCLCLNDNHGIKIYTLKDGVVECSTIELDIIDQAYNDAKQFDDYWDNGFSNNSSGYAIIELTKLMVISKHMVSKIEIERELNFWCKKYRVELDEIEVAIAVVWNDLEFFNSIKLISFKLGQAKKEIIFGSDQLIEASEWLKGRYHIKRIELTGDLLFWNDKYYETKADALIRRKGREIILKSQTKDMTEIVKKIEDTCTLITWRDIESSVHLKCLNNGIYNIKTGIFSTKFNPDYIIINFIPHDFSELELYDKIDGKVSQIISDDKDRQSYYDALSTCLHPYTGIDFQFGGVGSPGTGKSQLCELAQLVLGEDNVSNASIHQIAGDETTQKDIAYKMLNIDGDLSDSSIKHIDVLKKWITQDKFTARAIYEHDTTFKPMSRLMFMANDLYEIANSDDAEAIYERSHLIRIENKFRGQESEIKRVLVSVSTPSQLNGFITYLLKNATWIYNNNKIHYPMPYAKVENVWNTHGNRIKEFVGKWIEKGVSFRLQQDDPWNKWLGYCMNKNYKAKDKKIFREIFDVLVQNTATKTRINTIECYAYSGIRLITEEEMAVLETTPFDHVKNTEALGARVFSSSELFENYLLKLLSMNKHLSFKSFKIDYLVGDES